MSDARRPLSLLSAAAVLLFLCACEGDKAAREAARAKLSKNLVPYDSPALIEAAAQGDTQTIENLLDAGIDIDASVDGTALIIAAGQGQKATVDFLIAKGADLNVKSDTATALTAASREGHYAIVKALLDAGARPNVATSLGSPLYIAAENGHGEIVELLLERGANVDYESLYKERTPLMAAAEKGYVAAAEILIEHEADINAKDIYGMNALALASIGHHDDMVKALLDKGADVKELPKWYQFAAPENNSPRAMMLAIARGDEKAIRMIIAKGANVNAMAFGRLPLLSWAIRNHYDKGAEVLIAAGASTTAPDESGKTPLDYALSARNWRLAEKLKPDSKNKLQQLAKTRALPVAPALPVPETYQDTSSDPGRLRGQAINDLNSLEGDLQKELPASQSVKTLEKSLLKESAQARQAAKEAQGLIAAEAQAGRDPDADSAIAEKIATVDSAQAEKTAPPPARKTTPAKAPTTGKTPKKTPKLVPQQEESDEALLRRILGENKDGGKDADSLSPDDKALMKKLLDDGTISDTNLR